MVPPMSLAAIAAGADGLMLEVHHNPEEALSDGFQSLYVHQLKELIPAIQKQAELSQRTVSLQNKAPEIV